MASKTLESDVSKPRESHSKTISKEVGRFAEAFDIEKNQVIGNIALRYIAEMEAFEEVDGPGVTSCN